MTESSNSGSNPSTHQPGALPPDRSLPASPAPADAAAKTRARSYYLAGGIGTLTISLLALAAAAAVTSRHHAAWRTALLVSLVLVLGLAFAAQRTFCGPLRLRRSPPVLTPMDAPETVRPYAALLAGYVVGAVVGGTLVALSAAVGNGVFAGGLALLMASAGLDGAHYRRCRQAEADYGGVAYLALNESLHVKTRVGPLFIIAE